MLSSTNICRQSDEEISRTDGLTVRRNVEQQPCNNEINKTVQFSVVIMRQNVNEIFDS